jgi:hypothetical protein
LRSAALTAPALPWPVLLRICLLRGQYLLKSEGNAPRHDANVARVPPEKQIKR